MTIGEKIKLKRIESGLSQKDLGDLCGIHSEMISKYELGTRNPKLSTLAKIAPHLNVRTSYFLDTEPSARSFFDKALGFDYEELKRYSASLNLNIPQFIAQMVAQGVEVQLAKIQGRNPIIFNPELEDAVKIIGKIQIANGNICNSENISPT